MEFLYKLMGLSASVGSALSRQRVNMLPLSLGPVVLAVFFPLFAFAQTLELSEPRTPKAVGLKEIAADTYTGQRYVTVQGHLDPEVALSGTIRRSRLEWDYTWVAFVDEKSGGAVIAQFKDQEPDAIDFSTTSITGMLDNVEPELAAKLPEKVGKHPLSRGFVLKAGVPPYDPGAAPLVALGLAVPCWVFTAAWLRKYVIFQPDPAAAPEPSASVFPVELEDVRATGSFFLDGKTQQRFLSVPAFPNTLEDGSLGLYANVDASTTRSVYFIPVGKEERSGYWLLGIESGTVKNLQRGRQYLGWSSRPALRFDYKNGHSPSPESAVVSFGSVAERELMLASLQNLTA